MCKSASWSESSLAQISGIKLGVLISLHLVAGPCSIRTRICQFDVLHLY